MKFDEAENTIIVELWNIRNSLKRVALIKSKGTGTHKIMREAIHFLWEKHFGTKHHATRKRSLLACGKPVKEITFDHAIPLNYLMKDIFADNCSYEEFENIIRKKIVTCLIAKSENEKLKELKLNSKMPENCDCDDWEARYRVAGIKF